MERKKFLVDKNIESAVKSWYQHGLQPGSCTELLLRGEYEEAFKHAHPLIHEHWEDHIAWIKTVPIVCREHNYDSWRGTKNGGLVTFRHDDDDFTI